jgi:5-methylcytosine-specific restriction endonuclease McrA
VTRWGGRTATRLRAYWTGRLNAAGGALPCWRCGRAVHVRGDWHVGHLIDRAQGGTDTEAGTWPEHARCNLSAGGKVGARITNAKRATVQRRMDSERSRGIRGW